MKQIIKIVYKKQHLQILGLDWNTITAKYSVPDQLYSISNVIIDTSAGCYYQPEAGVIENQDTEENDINQVDIGELGKAKPFKTCHVRLGSKMKRHYYYLVAGILQFIFHDEMVPWRREIYEFTVEAYSTISQQKSINLESVNRTCTDVPYVDITVFTTAPVQAIISTIQPLLKDISYVIEMELK